MTNNNSHISDQDLLLAAEGELSKAQTLETQRHLASCSVCHARMEKMDDASTDFARIYREDFDPRLSSSYAQRALFKARLSDLASEQSQRTWWRTFRIVPFQ